ncbi:peptidoglycan L-alanyl-D-glutamate endopeptidase CwlK [Mesobacillus persicus]|uniref:Peptidoglycan L-alanyl-D-glutamate endopeptidase CwlK n=1 Tax=Mesobacillus persicus TaxID=930146 RepID=A0A1H8FQE1_9BACI|nr:M15 family metallopeptidase [Mesobacillus persicus]SEN33922.1 peptidoglycan L-alanyl-D-glutamate endopeptidase CwlK [Mesobacillus persicus]
MKIKRTRSHILLSCFAIIILLLYIQALKTAEPIENIPLPGELHPVLAYQSDLLIKQAEAKGIRVIITDDFRSYHEQEELYAIGRTAEGKIVTQAQAGESYHNFGLAVDFALLNDEGQAIWDMDYDGNLNGQSDWMEVVGLAKGLGFEWGGDWRQFKDYPHLQMDFGLSIRDLQRGERPPEQTSAIK